MTLMYHGATIVSVAVFLCFGLWCLCADGMRDDFDRFGMPRLRLVTGTLEVLGALGLLAGIFVRALAVLSSGGLALLMLLGVVTRVRHRDSLVQMLPATLLVMLNGYLAWYAVVVR